jgi:acetyl-CoA carboxylase biotin carboxyl carrier protein
MMAIYKLKADTQGTVSAIDIAAEDRIAAAQVLLRLEIMKMEIPVETPVAGRVTTVHVKVGEYVSEGQLLATIETA